MAHSIDDPDVARRFAGPSRSDRTHEDFTATFGRDPGEALSAMDRAGDDVAGQRPRHPIGLSSVGVTRAHVPVEIVDPFDDARTVSLSCALEATVSLSADRRGIHVSRVGDLIARLATEAFPSLREYVAAACALLRERQASEAAHVRVRGVLTYLERVPSARARTSLEHLELAAACRLTDDAVEHEDAVAFHHVTACPCVQQTFRHSVAVMAPDVVAALARHEMPALTHTQRSRSEVRIRSLAGPPSLPDWLAALDEVVVRCRNTMPRDVELHAVYRAHANPQFLEDAIRALAAATAALMRRRDPSAGISVRSVSLESIHDFDITGEVDGTAAELGKT